MKKKFQKIINEIDDLFAGELDLKTLSEKAATILSNKAGLIGAGIFVKESSNLTLHSFSQNKITAFINDIIGKDHSWIRISLDDPNNLLTQSIETQKILQADSLLFFPSSSRRLFNLAQVVHKTSGAQKYLIAPIFHQNNTLGTALFSTQENTFSNEQIELIQIFCDKLGLAFKNSIAHKRILNKRIASISKNESSSAEQELDAIKNIHNLLANKTTLKDAYSAVVSELVKKLDVSHAVILEWDDIEESLTIRDIKAPLVTISTIEKFTKSKVSSYVFYANNEEHMKNHYLQSLLGNKIMTSHNIYDSGIGYISESIAKKAQKALGMKMTITVPLIFKDIKLGVLGLSWKKEGISDTELQIIKTFGEHLSLAIYNIKKLELSKQTKNSYHDKILATTNKLFAGEFDFEKASEQAVTDFNVDMGFFGTSIYRKDGNKLRAYLYSKGESTKFIEQVLPSNQYKKIFIPFVENASIIARTGIQQVILETQSFENFAHNIVSDTIVKLLKRSLPKDLWYTSFPIMYNNKLEGVLAIGKRRSKLTDEEKEATSFFCEQLGLAMANIKAHNKILERYEKQQEMRAKNIDPDKKPTIKFTLRISKEIERYLTWKIHNTDQSKADFLRNLLTEDVIQEDQDYQDFLEN